MERIKLYKEITKKPIIKKTPIVSRRESIADSTVDFVKVRKLCTIFCYI